MKTGDAIQRNKHMLKKDDMWTCLKCSRVFAKKDQMHSCKKVPIEQHFHHKEKAKDLFDVLLHKIETSIGSCTIISLPCCVHLFGSYDFFAALPKKESLEIRLSLNRKLQSSKVKQCVPVSTVSYKHCFDISTKEQLDEEMMGWIKESYLLKR